MPFASCAPMSPKACADRESPESLWKRRRKLRKSGEKRSPQRAPMPKPGCKSIPNIKNRRSEFSQIQPEPPEKGGRNGARRIAEAKRRGRIFILDEKLPFRETETNKKTELGRAPSFCAKGLSFFAGGREKPAAIRENVSRQFFKRGVESI